MDSIKKNIRQILNDTAKAEGLEEEYTKHSFSRWRGMVNIWLTEKKSYSRFKNFLFFTQIFVGGASVVVGILVKSIQSELVATSIWIIYAAMNIFVNMVYKFYPDDYEKFSKDVKNLKLISLTERLAAKLALFERLTEHDILDDREVIDQISFRIKDIKEMSEDFLSVVEKCIDPKSRFSSSRDTNVTLTLDDFDLTEQEKTKLNHITLEICETAQILFGGKGYTAKLYLRTIKKYKNDEVEMLVAFSRHPTKENFGSSWVKSRGNLSAVWECLERGTEKVVDTSDQDLYYSSFLAICLPGRIGVLAIHNEDNDVFDKNVSKLDCKALALASKQLVMDALGIVKDS